jgi:hypothetical protein
MGVLVVLFILCFVGLIAVVEFLHARSRREVLQIVAEITPGTPFSAVTNRLGPVTQTFTSEKEIRSSAQVRIPGSSQTASFMHSHIVGHRSAGSWFIPTGSHKKFCVPTRKICKPPTACLPGDRPSMLITYREETPLWSKFCVERFCRWRRRRARIYPHPQKPR